MHLYIFTYKNLQGETVKTGIRDNNKKDAREYFVNNHSAGCQILNIETKYNCKEAITNEMVCNNSTNAR